MSQPMIEIFVITLNKIIPNISYVPQDINLIDDSIKNNIIFIENNHSRLVTISP